VRPALRCVRVCFFAMDTVLTDAQEALRAHAQELADREFRPRAARWDENEEFPEENWKILADQGLCGLTVPEAYGGLGLSDFEGVLVIEEIARACLSTAVLLQLFLNGPPRGVAASGTEEQKQRYLPRVVSGEMLMGIAMSEPDAGSAALEMRARVRRVDGVWRLDAYKNFITAGHHARAYFVVTRFPEAGERAIGAVLVPRDAAGVSVTKIHEKMGLRGMAEAEVAFDDVEVADDDILIPGDPDGSTFKKIISEFNHERCGNAAMCVGTAAGALDEALRYAQERIVGGKRIIEIQAIAFKLAEMATKVDAARLMLWRAARSATDGRPPDALLTAEAKWYANVIAQEVCNEAIQILGGYGYSREFPVERMYRDVRGLAIGAGTVEIQKNLIARLLDRKGPRPR
jgi:alkylation response protein AidB-like acyl-CoA dehydrogenase